MITAQPIRNCPHCHQPVDNPHARNCMRCGELLPLEVGSIVGGQYRILQPIGEGGSGSLYLAEDGRTFNRRCVLKRLHEIHNADERARFVSEVQTLTRLRHPQIPQVYAFFEEDNQPFMVMEYVAGLDLDYGLSITLADGRFLPGRPRPLHEALHDGVTVCSILEHLHSRTPPLVHCDVKPANLIRDKESNALFLVDFGAAMNVGAGENFGTPGYAAPEQYRGQQTTASDVYALAATLYHLMTDDDPSDHPHRFPKIDSLPHAIAAVLKPALHIEPSQRPNATRFRQDLERCLSLPGFQDQQFRTPAGGPIHTVDQLAAAALQDWNWFTSTAIEGRLQQWLRDNHQFQQLQWFNQQRVSVPLDVVLHELLQRLNPQIEPTKVELGQQRVELSAVNTINPYPLSVTTRGGVARVRVKATPMWLQVGPNELQLRPGETAAFQLAIDPYRVPDRNRHGFLELEADLGTRRPVQFKISVSIGSHGGTVTATAKQSTYIWTMVIACGFTILGVGVLASLMPEKAVGFVGFGIGIVVGIIYSWIVSAKNLDLIAIMGFSILGGILGGVVLPLYYTTSTPLMAWLLSALISLLAAGIYSLLRN